ncbi:MAG TPA: MucB/RseB C-terminal domain-containing protein [Gammaproteobacteria bacterium]|nr:MucB/RseB C-terminal domain-containing protein [Gammaproteobacteria bacterium]
MRHKRSRFILFATCALGLTLAQASEQDARAWLERMARAMDELNYQGVFVHMHDGRAETLRVVHRNEGGRVAERLVSLDGVGREIISTQDEVQCILPDKRAVLVETRTDLNPLVSAVPIYSQTLDRHYRLRMMGMSRVAGRPTQNVAVLPRDSYRYGYLLWLDEATAMPLKSQLRDEDGNIVEQILFASIAFGDEIPRSALQPSIDTDGYTWYRADEKSSAAARSGTTLWRAARVPEGFELQVSNRQVLFGSRFPVEHLVYSDGLASVSVFVESAESDPDPLDGLSRVGAANAYTTRVAGHQVTAVGEVPASTVEIIAESVQPQTLDARR